MRLLKAIAFVIALIIAASTVSVGAFSLGAAPIIGDANCDGEVTLIDATQIQRHLVGLETEADVGKPYINSYEALELNFVLLLEREDLDEGQDYDIYDPDDLTAEVLTHRTEHNVLIVERIIGQVTDAESRTGRIINTEDQSCDFISYKYSEPPVAEGTIMLSYLIYNPLTDGEDDTVNRYDFVLDRRFEVE